MRGIMPTISVHRHLIILVAAPLDTPVTPASPTEGHVVHYMDTVVSTRSMMVEFRLTFNRQDRRLLWGWMSTSIWDMRRSRRPTCTILFTSNVGPFANFLSSARNFYCPLNIYSIRNRTLNPCFGTFLWRQLPAALPSWLCLGSGRCRKLHSSADL